MYGISSIKGAPMVAMTYPPGPPARFPGANLWAFRRDPLGFLLQARRQYGNVVSFRLGPERVVLLTHPEHIRDVLVTQHRVFTKARRGQVAKQFLGEGLFNSEGDVHQRQRRLMQPAFHRQYIARYADVMTTYGERLSQQWQDGETLDMAQAMMRVTLAIAGKALFDADVEADAKDIGTSITTLMHFAPRFNLPFAGLLTRLPVPSTLRLRQAQRALDTVIYRIIDDRRRHGTHADDVLSMLVNAQDEDDGTGMTDKQLHDEALTLLVAGHETTAVALSWTWYLLAQHPQVEAALHEELASTLGGRTPTDADIPRLPYTRMILTEAMRLYPPAWMMTRRNLEAYEVGDYRLPPGTFLLISPYVTHHDPLYFLQPEAFRPERWAAEHDATRPKFAYFPFGGGPRQCLGEHFAWMEGTLLLATLAQRWAMHAVPSHPVVMQPLVTLRPKYGIQMRVQRREVLHTTAGFSSRI
jgi:cytochrome P450